jgi:hypothetical protein
MLRTTVSRSICLGVKPHLGSKNVLFLLSDSYVFVDVGRPLWWEDGYVVYSCCLSSSAQSVSGPTTAGLPPIPDSPSWRPRSRINIKEGDSYTPGRWVPFSSPPTIRRAAVEVFKRTTTCAYHLTVGSKLEPFLGNGQKNLRHNHFTSSGGNVISIVQASCASCADYHR